MSKEKQIEEMAWDLCDIPKHPSIKSCEQCGNKHCHAMYYAERAYNAGYRKQSENVIELPCKVGTTLYFLYNSHYADKPNLTPRIYKTTDWYLKLIKQE